MNEDEFKRLYTQLEEDVKASEELKHRTKASLRLIEETPAKRTASRSMRPQARKRLPNQGRGGAVATLPVWKTAVAACLAVAVGAGLLYGTGAAARLGAAFAGNSFTLAAYADESTSGANPPAGIGLDKFHPSRTSAGYLYDVSSDTVDYSIVSVNRYYAFDMSVTGNNVESVAYAIEGEGVSYGSWKSGQDQEGVVEDETSNSFTVPYGDGMPVIREIGLSYILDDSEKAEFDRIYSQDSGDEMETLLAKCDAKRLDDITLTATATYNDGSVQSKSYGFKPVEGFESMHRAYLSKIGDKEDAEAWNSLADEPALFELVEKGR
ncbi:hypothetical protein [Eggerthella sinensis]|uniref:hypothetical protein n=1 Tax=Eggerthella sinensis TaxID=242230 RepID=UPI00248E5E30|nr:hypothetical protein [Eggerthella sinensis]